MSTRCDWPSCSAPASRVLSMRVPLLRRALCTAHAVEARKAFRWTRDEELVEADVRTHAALVRGHFSKEINP